MLKTFKNIKTIIFALAVLVFLPISVSAGDSYGSDGWGSPTSSWGDSGWGTATYYDDYSWGDSGWGAADYYYPTQSYQPTDYYSDYMNYYNSYSRTTPSYTSTYVPTTGGGGSNTNVQTSSNSSASASASSTNINTNTNINNNNVYVYTTPQGNAVTYNPSHQYLSVTCTPSNTNPRVGESVTMTAYATGGVGNYTYSWSGDVYSYYNAGPTAVVTSNYTGTRTATVTVRSGQEVQTRSCSVTFSGYVQAYNYGYTYPTYTGSTVTTGNPVSGVYIQPGQIRSGTPVSGVYLNDLPATGVDLNWKHYMVTLFVLILGSVAYVTSRSRARMLKV